MAQRELTSRTTPRLRWSPARFPGIHFFLGIVLTAVTPSRATFTRRREDLVSKSNLKVKELLWRNNCVFCRREHYPPAFSDTIYNHPRWMPRASPRYSRIF